MTIAPYLSLFFSFCPFCLASKKEGKFEAGKARKINEPRPRGRERLLIFLYLSIFDSRKRENTLPDIPLDCIGISAGYIRFIHTSNKYGFSPCSKVFRIKKDESRNRRRYMVFSSSHDRISLRHRFRCKKPYLQPILLNFSGNRLCQSVRTPERRCSSRTFRYGYLVTT